MKTDPKYFFSFLSQETVAKSHKIKLVQNMLKFKKFRNMVRIRFFLTIPFLNQNGEKDTIEELTNTLNFRDGGGEYRGGGKHSNQITTKTLR